MIDPAILGLGKVILPNGQEIWIRKASFASQATASRSLSPEVAALATSAQTFGPGEPLPAAHPEEIEPRRFAYPPNYNIRVQPRSTEAISFDMLEALANNYDVARLAIEHRKNEMRGLEYLVRPKGIRDQKRAEAKARQAELASQIDAAMAFFASPNMEDSWSVWLGQWLENLFVIDAPTIYRRARRDGGLYGADVVEGSTIRPIIDGYGRVPQPPEYAYGQVMFGVTWGLYTTDELLYLPYWQRPKSPYGHPPSEWILLSINRALRRQSLDLTMFTEGTLPVGFYKVPEAWSGSQIGELQAIFDGILHGNDIERSRVRFVPGGVGTGLDQIHPEPKTEVEEWLLYLTCAAYGAMPTEIGFQPRGAGLGGKGFSEAQQDARTARATKPLANHIKGACDTILEDWLGFPELEMLFPSLDKPEDAYTRAQADAIYVSMGKDSVDELRERDDQDPIGLGPYIVTGSTLTLVDELLHPPAVAALGPDGQPLPPAPGPDAQPPADQAGLDAVTPEGDAMNEDQVVTKMAGDLGAWERKARRAIKAGRGADVPFTSDAIGQPVRTFLAKRLAKATSVDDVRGIFDLAKAGASADPFVSSTNASSSSSGATTSPARAPVSAASSRSTYARQPYP